MKVRGLVVLALLPVMAIPAIAQTCSNKAYTNSLICTLPQLFSPIGLTLPNPTHDAHFAGSSQSQLALPVSQGTGQALAILPLGSSGSGTTFTLDSEGHAVPTEDSLGPILTERANVIGKRAVSLGVAYQYFDFSHLDGISLNNFPSALTHKGWTTALGPGTIAVPVIKQDYIQTTNEVHLELNQTVIYAVVGVSKRMDASIEVPIQAAHFRVSSTAQIIRTQACEFDHSCPSGPNVPGQEDQAECGEFHYFQGYTDAGGADCPTIILSTKKTFPSYDYQLSFTDFNTGQTITEPVRPQGSPVQDAKGIGDITVRGKYELIHGEKLAGSVGLGIRFPSGDANNFLGTGAYGVIPFGALSYSGRFSPHVRFGYEWNSHSVLAGDPSGITGPSTASLPAAWLYSGGADYRVNKWLTVGADLIGQRVLDVTRLSLGSYSLLPETNGSDPSTESKIQVPSILVSSGRSSYSSDSVALGGKIRLKRELVLIGNATIRIDDGGLRADVVPLVGLSYAF